MIAIMTIATMMMMSTTLGPRIWMRTMNTDRQQVTAKHGFKARLYSKRLLTTLVIYSTMRGWYGKSVTLSLSHQGVKYCTSGTTNADGTAREKRFISRQIVEACTLSQVLMNLKEEIYMTVSRSFGTVGISKAVFLEDQRKEEETQCCQYRYKHPRRRRVQQNPIELRRAVVSDKVVSEYHPCTSNIRIEKQIHLSMLKEKTGNKTHPVLPTKTKRNSSTPFI